MVDFDPSTRIVGCVAVWLPVEHTRSEPIFEKRPIVTLSGYHESHHPQRLQRWRVC
jgi:hypothetical protein